MNSATPPRATYRLQFNRGFTFADAARIIPYLHLLGISHVYASPFLKARSGSPHGYDIVDHNALNPEIGDEAGFSAFVRTLHENGMGLLLDVVPNHMGIGGDDNAWWLDVLENGEASVYSGYFDIDWQPVSADLHNKILLPFLGDHYGTILERGELVLEFDAGSGIFAVRYHGHLFPIDPRSYPKLLGLRIEVLEQQLENQGDAFPAYIALINDCRALPRRTEQATARRQRRRHGTAACKRRLAELCRSHQQIAAFLGENVRHCNGTPGQPKSFDELHRLLEAQAYRLAYWKVAAEKINYRRFFDINELAGLRMEHREVFEATHWLVRRMIASGAADGLRIDHPDGLSDPLRYCSDLLELADEALNAGGRPAAGPFYLLIEKILASHERLSFDWSVAGTTGYDAAHLLNGLFVCPDSERVLGQIYSRFTGLGQDFDEVLYQRKRLIIRSTLASELSVLANLASRIARSDRCTRDFTYHGLHDALAEITACFPVYRTYITPQRISEEDRRHLHWAIAQAKKRSPAADIQIFDFIEGLLTLGVLKGYRSRVRRLVVTFALRFQQYTAPVMAKGMEDTAFYSYHRLVSLNDVGFDPRAFGISVNAFHHENRLRLKDWPQTMVTTSTHDSKRGEDVRARINVLSEIPHEWRRHLARWSRINRGRKRRLGDGLAPSRNDEYLLYQTLAGTWPLEPPDTRQLAAFRQRIEAYMLKAIREAKTHTSWINTNAEYEDAMRHFVHALLEAPERNAFLADFMSFQARVVRYGLLNSLSQTMLKLTMPGVPDIYQGNELWAFSLVDPDNRRPVDLSHRQAALRALATSDQNGANAFALLQDLLDHIEDGRAKLYLSWKTLHLRRRLPRLFAEGEYLALECRGPKAAHLCAFARCLDRKKVVVAAPRWFARLAGDTDQPPLGKKVWDDTWIQAPDGAQPDGYCNVLTNEMVGAHERADGVWLDAAALFARFPVALLTND